MLSGWLYAGSSFLWTKTSRAGESWRTLASLAVAALIGGWWFLRNFKLAGAIIWVGGTPSGGISVETFTSIKNVSWVSAFHSLFGSHIWIGNWSFLGVRSWMYEVFQYVTVLIAAGI